jgi:hypothetical protein
MIIPKAMVEGVNLTASAVTYYTAAAGVRTIIRRATFCNNSASDVTVTAYITKSGGVVGYANMIVKTHIVGAGETWACGFLEGHVLVPGSFITLLASSANVIGARISGYEVS